MLKKQLNLIGITGHAGVGKDTVADYLCSKFKDTWAESFAAPLKKACSDAFGIPLEFFHDTDLKETQNPYWEVTPRKIAQFFGTELFRDHIHKLIPGITRDFWIKRLEGKLNADILLEDDGEYEAGDTVIITDVRFDNEFQWLIENGGYLLHLSRKGFNGQVGIQGHASESGIKLNHPDYTWKIHNDGTLEDLYEEVDKFVAFTGFILTPKSEVTDPTEQTV